MGGDVKGDHERIYSAGAKALEARRLRSLVPPHSYKDIASRLGVAVSTVERFVRGTAPSHTPGTPQFEQSRLGRIARTQILRDKRKRAVFRHYGESCACCGESHLLLLTIDHLDQNGAEHRREIATGGGAGMYDWLIAQGFPEGYRTLCFNCNFGEYHGGCPHRVGGDA